VWSRFALDLSVLTEPPWCVRPVECSTQRGQGYDTEQCRRHASYSGRPVLFSAFWIVRMLSAGKAGVGRMEACVGIRSLRDPVTSAYPGTILRHIGRERIDITHLPARRGETARAPLGPARPRRSFAAARAPPRPRSPRVSDTATPVRDVAISITVNVGQADAEMWLRLPAINEAQSKTSASPVFPRYFYLELLLNLCL
jgi:hypothetical protein